MENQQHSNAKPVVHEQAPVAHAQTAPAAEVQPQLRADDNVIYIGKKPTMNYVMAVITQFSEGRKEIHIKARGMSISAAVDVAEVVRSRFVQTVKSHVTISSQEMEGDNNRKSLVSAIDIMLTK